MAPGRKTVWSRTPENLKFGDFTLCKSSLIKCPCEQKINSYFSLDFNILSDQALSLDLKRHMFILTGIFLFNIRPILTLSS